MEFDAVFFQLPAKYRHQFGIVPGHDRKHFKHRYPGSQVAVGLGHLDADGTAADDDQVFGNLAQIEDGFVGQVGHAVQAGDGRNEGGRPGGDHDAAGGDGGIAGLDRAAAGESPLGLDHMNAQAFEPFDGIMGSDSFDGAPHVAIDAGGINDRLTAADPESPAQPHGMGRVTGGQQGLGRNAAIVEAVAAHFSFFHKRRLGAHLLSGGGDGQAAGPGADDTDIYLQMAGKMGRKLGGHG